MRIIPNQLFIALLIVSSNALANSHTVPPVGAVANVTKDQICVSGYTKTVRPSTSFTDKLKVQWTPIGHQPSEYELDHYIPIELGGAPKDPNNLWMQVLSEARLKDVQETSLHKRVCKGNITLKKAQNTIRTWQ